MRVMRYLFIFLIVLTGCVQTENSSSQDAGLYGGGDTQHVVFSEARELLYVNCNSCHAYGSYSEQDFIDQGLVIAADPDNSELYYRMRGSQGALGPKDMPVTGQLTQAELQKIRDWILNL